MGDEVEVRREDQDKINKFSRLHQRELSIEEELKVKNVRNGSMISFAKSTADRGYRKRKKSSTTSLLSSSWPMRMTLSREIQHF